MNMNLNWFKEFSLVRLVEKGSESSLFYYRLIENGAGTPFFTTKC